MNIKQVVIGCVAGMAMWVNAGVVSNVNVSNRYPWNGMVDVKFNLSQDAAVTLTALDKVGGTNLTMKALSEAGVPMQNGLTCLSAGDRHVVWNAATDYPNAVFENVEISVSADEQLYMVINLTKNGDTYPVTYLAGAPKAGWSPEYKTKYLVLRKIKAGTFMMGSPEGEWGRGSNETQSEQTIDKDYYIAIFETTCGQACTLLGGYRYPGYSHKWGPDFPVSDDAAEYSKGETANEFITALSVGLPWTVSLPTEAQWEFACRAGTTTSVYTGVSPNSDYQMRVELFCYENIALYDGYSLNSGTQFNNHRRSMPVAMFRPNPWGLYDMLGNKQERCSNGVFRGGSPSAEGSSATSTARAAYRKVLSSTYVSGAHGFRIVIVQ